MPENGSKQKYLTRVGGAHPALIVVGDGYDRESAPDEEDIRKALESDSEWGLSNVFDIQSGPVEIQHESPPETPYDAWGVVVVFGQSPTVLEPDYDWEGPIGDAITVLNNHLSDIEIWHDAIDVTSRE